MAKPQKQKRDYTAQVFAFILFLVGCFFIHGEYENYKYLYSPTPEPLPTCSGTCLDVSIGTSPRGKSGTNYHYNLYIENGGLYSISEDRLKEQGITEEEIYAMVGTHITISYAPTYRIQDGLEFVKLIWVLVDCEGNEIITTTKSDHYIPTMFIWGLIFALPLILYCIYKIYKYIATQIAKEEKRKQRQARRERRAAARTRQAEKKAKKAAERNQQQE